MYGGTFHMEGSSMTVRAKQLVSVAPIQGTPRRARAWRVAACVVPLWLLSCGSSEDGGSTPPSTTNVPSTPSGNGSTNPNSGTPSGATDGAGEPTPSVSEQPAPTPMLQNPMEPMGNGGGNEEDPAEEP